MSPRNRLRLFAVLLLIVSALDESNASSLYRPKRGNNEETTVDDSSVDEAQYVMKIATSSELAMRRAMEATKKSNQQTTTPIDIMSDTSDTLDQENIDTVDSAHKQDEAKNNISSIETTQQTILGKVENEPLPAIVTNKNNDLNNSQTEINKDEVDLRTDGSNLDSFSTATVSNDESSSTTNDNESTTSKTTLPLDMIDMESEENGTTSTTTTKTNELKQNKTEQSTETMVVEQTGTGTTQASWKKYTVIERKRSELTTTPSSVTNENDLAKADSAQSRVTLEKTISNSPELPVLEKLKQDSTANITGSGVPDTKPKDVGTPRLDVINSKRGGYLNIPSNAITMEPLETSDGDAQDSEIPEDKKSQRQLENDAMKEEMLREEMFMGDARILTDEKMDLKVKNTFSNTENKQTSKESTNEKLSVKPIVKNAALYTVSPNYKPLKKIDVQPAKPFQRNPDDNSWRNESISSLGIVFKPKNSTKAFTEVLKNKTESELNAVIESINTSETPELRERLEKIAEVRKSKKKKVDNFGNTYYTDYEEGSSSSEKTNTRLEDLSSYRNPSSLPRDVTTHVATTQNHKNNNKKKLYNFPNYEDTSGDEEFDYSNLSNIDIKKYTVGTMDTTISPLPIVNAFTKPIRDYVYDRKPTIQYFPPRQKQKPERSPEKTGKQKSGKTTVHTTSPPVYVKPPVVYTTLPPPYPINHIIDKVNKPTKPPQVQNTKPADNEQLRFSPSPQISFGNHGYSLVNNEGDFNKASYVIKHYRDFEDSAKAVYDNIGNINPLGDVNKVKNEEYDYEKDVLNRFVEHFNQNSERFKVDFPVLFNSSVNHGNAVESGKQASSSAYLKRLYDTADKTANFLPKDCDANCINVELSPAYELHYYVPDQEEMAQQPTNLPYLYNGYQVDPAGHNLT